MQIEMPHDWYGSLKLAKALQETGLKQEACDLLESIINENQFKFDKYLYGSYEDYIAEKAKCFIELALLELEVKQLPKVSVSCLDQAIDLLDGMESVYPYVNINEVEALRKSICCL